MGSELISRSRETFLQLFWPSQSVVGGVTKSSARYDLLPHRRRRRRRRKYKQKLLAKIFCVVYLKICHVSYSMKLARSLRIFTDCFTADDNFASCSFFLNREFCGFAYFDVSILTATLLFKITLHTHSPDGLCFARTLLLIFSATTTTT